MTLGTILRRGPTPRLRAASPARSGRGGRRRPSRRTLLVVGSALALAGLGVWSLMWPADTRPVASAPDVEGPQPAPAAAPIEAGRRRATIDVTGTGFARVGDMVDVSATFDPDLVDGPPTLRLLRRARVLEIEDMRDIAERTSRVALAVQPEEVEKLAYADENAILSLSVHPEGKDDEQGETHPLPDFNEPPVAD